MQYVCAVQSIQSIKCEEKEDKMGEGGERTSRQTCIHADKSRQQRTDFPIAIPPFSIGRKTD